MADRENIRLRSLKVSPQITAISEDIERVLIKYGLTGGAILTECMTTEEEEMALFESYIKEGYSQEEADRKAKESLALMRKVFRY
jgi:hypothetical protein